MQILVTRRCALGCAVGCIAILAGANDPAHAAKAAKRDFSYQDQPKGAASCGSCKLFSPGAEGVGSCAVVEGEVSRNGWCMAYTAKA